MKKLGIYMVIVFCILGFIGTGCKKANTDTHSSSSVSTSSESSSIKLRNEEVHNLYVKPYGMLIGLQEDWSTADELDVNKVLGWSYFYAKYEDKDPGVPKYGESYDQKPYGYLFSQSDVETFAKTYFGLSAQQVQKSYCYVPDKQSYAIMVNSVSGERYYTNVSDYKVHGDTIEITVDYFKEADDVKVGTKALTIALSGTDSFQYIACHTIS
ncbi:hypothetical protein [Neobittarella massiliensis]|uniref:Lipoprotein n=2 Tax=Oscillospiraceae TaxID=216572 RepID=A0A8J6IRF2_9FIRM|nr:hypothetical protein [Neobittarella massiliensis]MBC3516938.1 hypothetical protein [Neobittarella massiliensis]SCJ82101.1 Uncharacterised protein [uncultured Anaerotruncus sp.]